MYGERGYKIAEKSTIEGTESDEGQEILTLKREAHRLHRAQVPVHHVFSVQ